MGSGGWMLPSITLWLFCLVVPNLGSYPGPFSRLCCLHPAGTPQVEGMDRAAQVQSLTPPAWHCSEKWRSQGAWISE